MPRYTAAGFIGFCITILPMRAWSKGAFIMNGAERYCKPRGCKFYKEEFVIGGYCDYCFMHGTLRGGTVKNCTHMGDKVNRTGFNDNLPYVPKDGALFGNKNLKI